MPRLRKLAGRNARRRRGGAANNNNYTWGSGGGSGEIYTKNYKRGAVFSVTIGSGGIGSKASATIAYGGTGGTTIFGDLTLYGGGGGRAGSSSEHGSASGSIATSGIGYVGGYGNKNNTSQTYGNGGAAQYDYVEKGKDGAVILTYLGR